MNAETTTQINPYNAEASGLIQHVAVRLTSAYFLAALGIEAPRDATDMLEAIKAIIEGAIRKLDACDKTIGGAGVDLIE